MSRAPEAGFTLIEALVAMAVLAVGAVSLLSATESHSTRIGQVIERTAARWVAEARLTELRLGLMPDEGPVESYGRDWRVTDAASPTDDAALVRITVSVAPSEGIVSGGRIGALVTLTGYLESREESG